MHDDGLDDHPDLIDLRLSKGDERAALAVARRQRKTTPRGPSFLRRHRTKVVAVAALAVVIAAGAALVNDSRTAASRPGAVDVPAGQVPVGSPFVGTPAAAFADGEAGIVAPEPVPVAGFPAAAVADAYAKVRQVLVTARLDRAVLEGHDVERYLTLLAPDAQAGIRPMFTDHPAEAYAMATRVADGFHLARAVPKVTGSMTAAVTEDGALLVHTSYVFAYAFAPADRAKVRIPTDVVTVDRFEADYTITDDRWPRSSRGVWPGQVNSYHYGMACALFRTGMLAPGYSERLPVSDQDTAEDEETAVFDPKQPLPTASTCT